MWNYSLIMYLTAVLLWGSLPPANPSEGRHVHPDGQVVSQGASNPTEIGPIGTVADPKGR